MDFFDHQDRARRNTWKLMLLFVLALCAITGLVYLIVLAATRSQDPIGPLVMTFLGVLLGVGGGTLLKTGQLRAGGGAGVAESLGGRRIGNDTAEPLERRLINVVEEMALASGAPVPPVYLMERERGINAFAAGYTPETAVIGVTRGCVEQLSRDELQGVIAHEFSHILHGDMRLNIRLIGVIFGLVGITVIGRVVMQTAYYGGATIRRNDREGGGAPLILIGLGLLIVGSLGVLFGRLIQSAASRQREYLADASAVQYTRNPDGIAGALRQIAGLRDRSKLATPHAEEAAHMFFSPAISGLSGLGGWFATHPPIVERVARIEQIPLEAIAAGAAPRGTEQRSSGRGQGGGTSGFAAGGAVAAGPAESEAGTGDPAAAGPHRRGVVERVGHIDAAGLAAARATLERVPHNVRRALRHTEGAEAVVLSLLLSADPDTRQRQARLLREQTSEEVQREVGHLEEVVRGMNPRLRLPVLELACGALTRLTAIGYARLTRLVEALIQADQHEDASEWVIRVLLERHLSERFGGGTDQSIRYQRVQQVTQPVHVVLSVLAHVGAAGDAEGAAAAYREGAERVPTPDLPDRPADTRRLSLDALREATDSLAALAPRAQRQVVEAMAAVVLADGRRTLGEIELLRGIMGAMGVPLGVAGEAPQWTPSPQMRANLLSGRAAWGLSGL